MRFTCTYRQMRTVYGIKTRKREAAWEATQRSDYGVRLYGQPHGDVRT